VILLSIIIGFSIGLTFFGEIGRLFGVDEMPVHYTLFRMVMIALIVGLAWYGGWGHDWSTEVSLQNNLTLGLFILIGLSAREPLSEYEYELGLARLFNPILSRLEPKSYRGPVYIVNAETDSFVQLVLHFFGHRQGLDIHALLAGEPLLKNVDSVQIQNLLQRQMLSNQPASRILGRLAFSRPKSFVKIVDHLLKFSVGAGLADPGFLQRLFIVAGGEGMSSSQYEGLLGKYGLRSHCDRRYRTAPEDGWTRRDNTAHSYAPPQSERDRYLGLFGLTPNATAKEIKKAYRKLAKVYHPDRNRGKSEREQDQAAAKMRELNLAFDWLKTNG